MPRNVLPIALSAVVLLAGAALHSSQAACAGSHELLTRGAYLVSNPDWGGAGGAGTCDGGFGCYDYESGPPVSPDLLGIFWALGTGDPTIGYGDDSGAWAASNWTKSAVYSYGSYSYYYPAWMTQPTGPGYLPGAAPDWSLAGDGCFLNAGPTTGLDGTECTAVLLADHWNSSGYFSLLTASLDALDDFSFLVSTATPIKLHQVPDLVHTSYDPLNPADPYSCNHVLVLSPVIPQDALHLDPLCGDSTILGFKVYGQCLPRGSLPPDDPTRDDGSPASGWEIVAGGEADTGDPLPLDQAAYVDLNCAAFPNQDGYLAMSLVMEDGFELPYLSGRSARIECCRDDDGDGHCFYSNGHPGDCDDNDPLRNWWATDVPDDGIDQDCNGADTVTCFVDSDRDGFGSSSTLLALDGSCDPISGEVLNADDCDDSNAATYPGAIETNDGADNDCQGFSGHGSIDEISGTSGFNTPNDRERYSWDPQPGAVTYEVGRAGHAQFDSCQILQLTENEFVLDSSVPSGGEAYYYLVRSMTPFAGSWGLGLAGQEREISCAP